MKRVESIEFLDFEWNESKRQRIWEEREIDFSDAARALLEPHLEKRSDQNGEVRLLAICKIETEIVAVIYTLRDRSCRIITARAARRNERRQYSEILG